MENPRKAAKCMDFLSTGEMMDFHRKGGRNGEGKFIHRESTHREQEMWRKGVGQTLRNPIGKPSVGATLAVARGRGFAPPLRTTRYAFVGAGGCPPSCQPISGHCRVRQSGHFLETGSLPLPLAALRRFPRRPEPDFSRTHGRAHGPCPTRRCVIGPGRTGPSAPIRPLSPGWY